MKDGVRLNKGKLHKIELYVVDPNNQYYDVESMLLDIEILLYKCIVKSFASNTVELDWNDDIDSNIVYASEEGYKKYFSNKKE